MIIGSGEVNVYNTKKMEPGKWYNVRIQIQSETLTLRIANKTGETESSIEIPEYITIHDVNADGKCDIADAVLLQKYLLTVETVLPDWQTGDMDENGTLNAIDLTLLKRLLMQ